jgi:hypothetical protein
MTEQIELPEMGFTVDPVDDHPEVDLPELGFSVDEGLEELIRLCWQRGIATISCCVGRRVPQDPTEFGYVVLLERWAAARWRMLTGRPVEWHEGRLDEAFEMTVPGQGLSRFRREEIPELVDALRREAT